MFKSCALMLLSCAVLLVGLSSMALSHFHRSGDIHSLVSEELETCSASKALRRETIRALPGDRRWTREACAEHWAEGIDRVAHVKLAKKRIFLAMNLKNNEQVFDHLRGELLLLADYLGPSRLYISIYESGSSDSTPQKLQTFKEELRLLQIPNMILTNGVGKRADQTRIDFLANARNTALAPLLHEIWHGPFGNHNAGKYYHGHGCCEPLSAIEVYASESKIYGIQFSFGGVRKGRVGSPLGELFALILKPKEVVVSVAGAGGNEVTKLVVTTSLGRMLAAGNVQQKGWESKGARLEDVRGYASEKAVHALSFAWAKDDGAPRPHPRFDRVLILNDGYLCLEDILLLLMHDAHMVTAVDTIGLREEEKTRRLQVYDTWVGRDVNGKEQGREFPLSNIPQFRQWFAEGKPFPVFCACHGAVNIDADVFYKKRITFRNRGWEGECAASEYSFLCKDIWRAYGNDTRIVMDPRVVIGVDEPAWEDVVLARSKKLPSHFKEAPFDVGIQPSPWRKLPDMDMSFVRDTLRHLRGLKLTVPRQVTCAPIHHESIREAALIGKYEENSQGVTVYPRGPWARAPECLTEADAYPSRNTDPGQSMYYFNSAGRQVFDQKRLTIGGGDRLVSPNFQYMFIMQKNRECVMHTMTTPFKPIWRWPMCDDPSINYIEFQGDGNLVAYAFDGSVKHATGTVQEPKKAAHMALGNDGHLVLRTKTGKVLWEAEREFLVEDTEWERRRPGKQIFIPVTLRGDDIELEAASAFGDLCRALTGRVFFSLVTLSDAPPVASESVITAVLLEFVCSFKSSGVASTLEEANALHFESFNEWSTGYAYSCAKAFPAVPTSFCPKSFVQEVRDSIRNPNGLEPCTKALMDGTSISEICCDRPSLE